ncbi:hypothetical protein [Rhizobium tumorigenes]|uniref:Uncharacterized protein n=1 Tax=Rhizobium tumorigenes TaxID=2041385 RepID=A0AAF1KVQ7_9HYPH|nr:hypothetical protein [Rhizobium tumorigenes]WFR96866.1 hypothetical protein PR017_07065 [Rhizobium tumorigenes]
MGRPPMGFKELTIRLTAEMSERIDQLAGKNRRAEWIRQVLQEALDRQDIKSE